MPDLLGKTREEPKENFDYEPNRRGREEGGSNRNEWT